jgi:hypothetical protein
MTGKTRRGMDKEFLFLLWSNVKTSVNAVFVTGGVISSIVLWSFRPDETIRLLWVVPLCFGGIILVITFLSAAIEAYRMNRAALPAVVSVKQPRKALGDESPVLVMQSSDLFSPDIVVAVYFSDADDFEEFIGIGAVINVQENGLIQVHVSHFLPGHDQMVRDLINNNAQALKKLRVKPYIPMSYMHGLGQGVQGD